MISELREKLSISDDMPYGGIPYSKIIPKYEATDPNLIKTGIDHGDNYYNSYDNLHDETPYENYARAEIMDWSSDAPLFESDHTRRDPGLSRSMVNIRYNGNRGNTGDLPRHPELFIGFTGNDPRGATNDPRLEQMRGFATAHAANVEVRMGKNDDNHLAERPWTNQSLSYDKKYGQQITSNNMKIFTAQKEGRPYSRNIVTDLPTWGRNQNIIRKSNMTAGDETIDLNNRDGYGEYIDIGGEVNQILSNDLQKMAKMNAPSIINMHTTDHSFDTQINNFNQGAGNNKMSNIVSLLHSNLDHINIDSINALSANNNTLASSMALAAKTAANMKNTQSYNKQGMAADPDIEHDNNNVKQRISNTIQNIYKNVEMDGQKYGESNETSKGKGFTQQRTTEAGKYVVQDTQSNMAARSSELTSTIVKGLKENSASSKRKIANQVVAHFTPKIINDESPSMGKSILPSKDYIKNSSHTVVESAIFKNLVGDKDMVNKYQPSRKKEKKVHFSKSADTTNWKESYQTQFGKNAKYTDDQNRTNKTINALSPTQWANSYEMQILKSKNPELYNKVKKDYEMSVMNWNESIQTQGGRNPHEIRQSGMAQIGGKTYNPDMWNNGYAQREMGKNQSLPNRRSAQNDPTVLGTNKEELFKENYQSFTPSNGYGGPKTLRGGTWNNDTTFNELNDLTHRTK